MGDDLGISNLDCRLQSLNLTNESTTTNTKDIVPEKKVNLLVIPIPQPKIKIPTIKLIIVGTNSLIFLLDRSINMLGDGCVGKTAFVKYYTLVCIMLM
jgi:hypothetical protein